MEKSYRIEGSPSYPSYLGRDNFSYVSLLNLGNRLHDKQNFFSAGGVTHLAGPPVFHGLRTQFPPYKHFGSPIWVNSVKARQSEHTRALLTQVKGQFLSHVNTR